MYRDNTLIPSEAIRLLALGTLATRAMPYGELASEARQFAAHVVGPSLDLIGAPLELLKLEGLVEAQEAEDAEDAPLAISESGRRELVRLMSSNVRPPVSDINKLIITLKLRFLHLLEPAAQRLQVESLAEMCERELARLNGLRARSTATPGHLLAWLDQEIAQTQARLDWFRALRRDLG